MCAIKHGRGLLGGLKLQSIMPCQTASYYRLLQSEGRNIWLYTAALIMSHVFQCMAQPFNIDCSEATRFDELSELSLHVNNRSTLLISGHYYGRLSCEGHDQPGLCRCKDHGHLIISCIRC
jgi:hypothetical protein